MPNKRLAFPKGSTPFPNLLIDRVMPRVRDTEWRLLTVILRQTWGWRKERDWLSHSQLKRRTGRSSAAISKAIAALVQAHLILVRNRAGEILNSVAERRREQGSLYFSLHPVLVVHLLREQVRPNRTTNSQKRNNKSQFDKRKRQPVDRQKKKPSGRLSTTPVDKRVSGRLAANGKERLSR